MKTEISNQTIAHYTDLKTRALDRFRKIQQLNEGSITLEEINRSLFFGINGLPSLFSTLKLQTEVRSNLLSISDEEKVKYLHYFIKILHDLKSISRNCGNYIRELEEINEGEIFGGLYFQTEYQSVKHLILHDYLLFSEALVSELNVWLIIKKEFGIKVKDWKQYIANQRELPSVSDVRTLLFKQANDLPEGDETLPLYEYKSETQKIAWLYELGIIEYLLDKCKNDETFNWRRTANILNSITGINPETIRKTIQAIYLPNEGNKKNNPLNNPDNRFFLQTMSAKFKLEKEK
jgi:hypothetical protein